jgi:putative tryptophan/tyrosine transport system substrate-binding protein
LGQVAIPARWATSRRPRCEKDRRKLALGVGHTLPAGLAQFGAIQSVASSVEVSPVDVRDAAEINAFALGPNGGLIVVSNPTATVHRKLITTLAARHRLPAVYPFRYYVVDGGLMSYGPDLPDQFRSRLGCGPT